MSETPHAAETRKIVDDLEDRIVDVDAAGRKAGDPDVGSGSAEQGKDADDKASEVPGSPEPTD